MKSKKKKLAVVMSHPIQYYVSLLKALSAYPELEVKVYFCSSYGVQETFDPAFGVSYKWDTPLLEGYQYEFLKN